MKWINEPDTRQKYKNDIMGLDTFSYNDLQKTGDDMSAKYKAINIAGVFIQLMNNPDEMISGEFDFSPEHVVELRELLKATEQFVVSKQ